MNILDNDLVKKYFGCGESEHPIYHQCNEPRTLALAIIKAMQEPIRKGDKYLTNSAITDIHRYGDFDREMTALDDIQYPFHPFHLRLPDQFQTAGKKECACLEHHCYCLCHGNFCKKCDKQIYNEPQPDAVEEKIKEIVWGINNKKGFEFPSGSHLVASLRELVRLAQEHYRSELRNEREGK